MADIALILRESPALTVAEIVTKLKELDGGAIGRKELNQMLYKAAKSGECVADDKRPPRWRLARVDAPLQAPAPLQANTAAEIAQALRQCSAQLLNLAKLLDASAESESSADDGSDSDDTVGAYGGRR
jgi:hypothetical protein